MRKHLPPRRPITARPAKFLSSAPRIRCARPPSVSSSISCGSTRKSVLRGIPFLVLLAFGLFNYLGGAPTMENTFGTSVYPVTALMMEYMQGSYQFLLIIIVAFYAGDVLWRERDAKLAEVTDSLPVPNWVPLLSKLGAITAVVFAFTLFGVLAAIGYQLWHGYTKLEPLVYLQAAFIDSWPWVLMGALALFLQIISNQKFIGYLVLILVLLSQIVLGSDRLRAQLVYLRRRARHDVFGHERLRSSAAAVRVVPNVLDAVRRDADRACECILGAWHGVALESALARRVAESARSAGRCACESGAGVRHHGRLDFLQHQHHQRVSARRCRAGSPGATGKGLSAVQGSAAAPGRRCAGRRGYLSRGAALGRSGPLSSDQ